MKAVLVDLMSSNWLNPADSEWLILVSSNNMMVMKTGS